MCWNDSNVSLWAPQAGCELRDDKRWTVLQHRGKERWVYWHRQGFRIINWNKPSSGCHWIMLSPVLNLWPATGGYSRGFHLTPTFHLTPAFHHGQKNSRKTFRGSTETSLDIVKQVSANIKISDPLFWVPGHQPSLLGRDSSWCPVLLECTDANRDLCQLERLFHSLCKVRKGMVWQTSCWKKAKGSSDRRISKSFKRMMPFLK